LNNTLICNFDFVPASETSKAVEVVKAFFVYKEEECKVIWLMELLGIIKAFRTFQFIKMKKRE
jgi:hypothetical protein